VPGATVESAPSAIVSAKTAAQGLTGPIAAAPVPPVVSAAPATSTLSVIAVTAYDLPKANDSITLKAVGSVPIGTKCNAAMSALGMFIVPRKAVTLTPGLKTLPQAVFAKCG
jgi:hypothetical protein